MRTSDPDGVRHPNRLTLWDHAWRVLVSISLGGLLWLLYLAVVFPENGPRPDVGARTTWLVLVDPLLGLLATGLMLLRRRWPVTIAVLTSAMTAVSVASAGAQTIALCSVGTRRRWREILVVGLAATAAGVVISRLHPELEPSPLWVESLLNLLVTGIILAVGYSIGSRRALAHSWYERARTTESEQRARVAQARAAERNRIAREMHDVLAHRISLVTMHSGLLSYRQDLPEEERAAAVTAIDTNARAALTDLREVLGVLRDPDSTGDTAALQTDLHGLDDLAEEATAAGTRVHLETGAVDVATVPEPASRTAYRVVQEGLTNARKHAPGARVDVVLSGGPEPGLDVHVTNPRSVRVGHGPATADGAAPFVPGAGLGLLGLLERVDLAGGRLEHGWEPDEQHHLRVWLPWSE